MNPDLLRQYEEMHKHPKRFRGGFKPDVLKCICNAVEFHKPLSLLDYGSGKGRQYLEFQQHHAWGGILPVCYDPAYEPFAHRPTYCYDGVICTDVAEHVPEDEVDGFLKDVVGFAIQFVVFDICTRPARKTLPDGRNAHLTVRPADWWLDRIGRARVHNMLDVRVVFHDR